MIYLSCKATAPGYIRQLTDNMHNLFLGCQRKDKFLSAINLTTK